MIGTYSIIIPVYNGEKYLREAVESALNQSWAAAQIILVDDGSTDSSGKICDEYAERYRQVEVIHRQNGGLSVARNTGIDAAQTDCVMFLDADDKLCRDAAACLACMTSEPEVDLAIGGCTMEDLETWPAIDFTGQRTTGAIEAIEETLYQTGTLHSAWGKLLRRQFLDEVRFTEGILYEDLDFFYRYCLLCRKVAIKDDPLIYYRQQRDSIMHIWKPKRADVLDITDRIEAFMAENYPDLLPAARDRKFSAYYNIYLLATANGDRAIADRCWKIIKEYRRGALNDPKVRLKNKAGALLSYLGRPVLKIASKWGAK